MRIEGRTSRRIMVSDRCLGAGLVVLWLTLHAERIPGKDYGAGVKRYAFAAPFTKIEERGVTARAQEVM